MSWKKMLLIISSVLIVFLIGTPAGAQNSLYLNEVNSNDWIQPYFTNILLFQNQFDISSSGKAIAFAYLTARNVDQVRIDISLQQYNNGSWKTIKDWTTTSSGTNIGLDKSYYISRGYTYRMISNGYVYENGILIENTSFISSSINY